MSILMQMWWAIFWFAVKRVWAKWSDRNKVSLMAAAIQTKFIDLSAVYDKRSTYTLPDGMVVSLCKDNSQKRQPNGKADLLVFHWSAGTYNQCFDGYHYCICFNPKTNTVWVIKTLKHAQKGYHLWGRNGGSIAISFMAMRGASSEAHPGQYPVLDAMAEAGWALAAELGMDLGLKLDPEHKIAKPAMASNATRIWPTGGTIYIPTVVDHKAMAIHDGYPGARWDVGTLFPNAAKKVYWYFDKFINGKRERLYKGKLL
jgi:hypothetical protein